MDGGQVLLVSHLNVGHALRWLGLLIDYQVWPELIDGFGNYENVGDPSKMKCRRFCASWSLGFLEVEESSFFCPLAPNRYSLMSYGQSCIESH